ncbi:hypothetical protein BDZ89DRAFT_1152682 [Hymenopellis radicata]|nr:hypothetical protein BDZ89DRAFT_1152682 [Hymenopellis radicata]
MSHCLGHSGPDVRLIYEPPTARGIKSTEIVVNPSPTFPPRRYAVTMLPHVVARLVLDAIIVVGLSLAAGVLCRDF